MTKTRRRTARQILASDFPDAAAPASRAAWTGCIRIGSVIVPVRGYPSVMDDDGPQLHQFHRDCGERIQCPRLCPTHGALSGEEIEKGLDLGDGRHVILTVEQLQRLRPPKDEELVMDHFIANTDLDPVMFAGRHLYLTPATRAAIAPFTLIVAVLGKLRKSGISQLTINGKRSLVAVSVRNKRLAVHFLHYSNEIRAVPEFDSTGTSRGFGAELVTTFVNEHNSQVDWSSFRNPIRQIVSELAADRRREGADRKKKRKNSQRSQTDKCNPDGVASARPRRALSHPGKSV